MPVENRVELATKKRNTLLYSRCDRILLRMRFRHGIILIAEWPLYPRNIPSRVLRKDRKIRRRAKKRVTVSKKFGERGLASAAKLAGVSGIFHSDELPAYGISQTEVNSVRSQLSLSEADAFVLCMAPKKAVRTGP
ncbi:MAG: hypothetical protein Ct9H90mP21_3150 [Methanobacteriota archaeon]|nr:MAG: hypothetical protein Ct9H90mP21_3150 [Euryarchaeota archaeon]